MADEPIKGDLRVLSARVELVETLREDFGLFLKDLGIDEQQLAFWQLVLSEAVVNAIQHGCNHDPQLKVEVKWMNCGQEVLLEVRDPGAGPSEEVIRSPGLPEDPYQSPWPRCFSDRELRGSPGALEGEHGLLPAYF